jgi:GntR family transcriptional regulator
VAARDWTNRTNPPYHARVKEPLHSVIASRIEASIRSGHWLPGSRLPPERELGVRFDVSRATLRLALAELEERGLISRHQGRGTYVSRPRVETAMGEHFTIRAALEARGMTVTTRVLTATIRAASRQVAQDLGIRPGEPVIHVERLRSADGEPLLIDRADVPAALFAGLERADLATRSLYDVMRDDHGRWVTAATETLEPVLLAPAEAALLEVPAQSPAMLVRRVSTDQGGTTVELAQALVRGDRSRFLLERRIPEPYPGAAA